MLRDFSLCANKKTLNPAQELSFNIMTLLLLLAGGDLQFHDDTMAAGDGATIQNGGMRV